MLTTSTDKSIIEEEGRFNPLGVALNNVLKTDIPYMWPDYNIESEDFKENHKRIFGDMEEN